MNILSLITLILAPIAAIFIILSPLVSPKPKRVKAFAFLFGALHFLYSSALLLFFKPDATGFAYTKELTIFGKSWLESMGISFNFAVDSLAMGLCVLCSFLFFLSIVTSRNIICSKQKLYYSMMFLLESSILGIFCSQDMFAFYLFWMLATIPSYFLLSLWGKKKERKAAMNYVLYSVLAGFVLLFGILCVYFSTLDTALSLTGNMHNIDVGNSYYPQWFRYVMFACFLIGFGSRLPIVPFHVWFPKDLEKAATPVSMIIAGVLLNVGVYGLVRFNLQIFPEIFEYFAPILIVIGIVNIFYSAILISRENSIKRIAAYFAVCNSGLILIGLGSLTEIGFGGAAFHMIASGIVTACLLMCAGSVYLRTKSYDLEKAAGIISKMPNASFFFKLLLICAVCIPGFVNFPGCFTSILGIFLSDLNVNLNILATVTALFGVFMILLKLVDTMKIMFGETSEESPKTEDLSKSEVFVYSVFVLVMVVLGIAPFLIFNFFDSSMYLISSVWQV